MIHSPYTGIPDSMLEHIYNVSYEASMELTSVCVLGRDEEVDKPKAGNGRAAVRALDRPHVKLVRTMSYHTTDTK